MVVSTVNDLRSGELALIKRASCLGVKGINANLRPTTFWVQNFPSAVCDHVVSV